MNKRQPSYRALPTATGPAGPRAGTRGPTPGDGPASTVPGGLFVVASFNDAKQKKTKNRCVGRTFC